MVGIVCNPKPHPCKRLQLPGLHPSFADCSAVGTVAIGYKMSVPMLEIKLGYIRLRKGRGLTSKAVITEASVSLHEFLLASGAVANR